MQLTAKIKLIPTVEHSNLINSTLSEYVCVVNSLVDMMFMFDTCGKPTTKSVDGKLPSALKNQCILDAKSIFKTFRKRCFEDAKWNNQHQGNKPRETKLPILRKPVAIWNNQNFNVLEDSIRFPVWNEKSTRITVKALITPETLHILHTHKLGTMRITCKNGKLIAQITYEVYEEQPFHGNTMGVDLGIKCPAVCYTDTGKIKFVGNGRKNKTMRRHFQTKRKKLGKAKKPNAIKKLNQKEQRIMEDVDHKLSREIVNFAVKNGVSTIKMEKLANIRQETRKSRKNNRSLSNWSFYRLASFIEYKAKLLGIQIVYVNPAYTSQVCPICGKHNHSDDRNYQCACGFHMHRDIVGAMNICCTN